MIVGPCKRVDAIYLYKAKPAYGVSDLITSALARRPLQQAMSCKKNTSGLAIF